MRLSPQLGKEGAQAGHLFHARGALEPTVQIDARKPRMANRPQGSGLLRPDASAQEEGNLSAVVLEQRPVEGLSRSAVGRCRRIEKEQIGLPPGAFQLLGQGTHRLDNPIACASQLGAQLRRFRPVQLEVVEAEAPGRLEHFCLIGIDKHPHAFGSGGKIGGRFTHVAGRGGIEDETHQIDAEGFHLANVVGTSHAAYFD